LTLYTADWCQPCKQLKQWLSDKPYKDDIEIVNVDELVEKPKWLRGIPALDVGNKQYVGNETIRPYLEKTYA
jgi:glutaredoxin